MRLREPWPAARSRQRRREFDWTFAGVPEHGLGRALELGGGDAFMASLLGSRCESLVTTERYPGRMARVAGVDRLACDVVALPFRDGAFNFIYSSSVLEHVRDLPRGYTEMRRCLAPEGVMIHVMPSITWKLLQMLLYYVHYVVAAIDLGLDVLSRALGGSKQATTPSPDAATDEARRWSTDERRWPGWRQILRSIVPTVHGEFAGHGAEFRGFAASSWAAQFRTAGFAVHGVRKLPLYSGYGFGLERLRRLGERWGLSAHNALVVTHPDASPAALAWFLTPGPAGSGRT